MRAAAHWDAKSVTGKSYRWSIHLAASERALSDSNTVSYCVPKVSDSVATFPFSCQVPHRLSWCASAKEGNSWRRATA